MLRSRKQPPNSLLNLPQASSQSQNSLVTLSSISQPPNDEYTYGNFLQQVTSPDHQQQVETPQISSSQQAPSQISLSSLSQPLSGNYSYGNFLEQTNDPVSSLHQIPHGSEPPNSLRFNPVQTSSPTSTLHCLRQHPTIYNDKTILLDISPDHWGTLTGKSPSFTFIPEKFVRKTRSNL